MRSRLLALACVLCAGASLGLAPAAGASSLSQSGIQTLAQNGFGERDNSYAWSMDWFKGKLYVGTGRDVLCVEDQTTQFYDTFLNYYNTDPQADVHCPGDPYDMRLRAQIWQYTPARRSWKMVYRAPARTINPAQPRSRVASDIGYRGMVTYADRSGRTALYAAGLTADEYLPQLLKTHPPRILRSYDGVHWHALRLPAVTVNFPYGSLHPMGFRSLLEWKGRLFVTATPDLTGDGALFEVTRPWSQHPGLVQVSPPNLDIFEIAKFDGRLYVGCGNAKTGYSVWETSGHGQEVGDLYAPYPFVFRPVVTGGAGRGAAVTSVVSMQAYKNALYVGASGWYNKNTNPLSELIRIRHDGSWALVVGKPRRLEDGSTAYPVSGLEDGFGSLFNAHFWRMASSAGGLYVGTNSWSYLLKASPGNAWLGDIIAPVAGYQLWATCDGQDFFPVTRDAFGHSEFDFGARTLAAGGPGNEELFLGSANHAQGTTVLDDREPVCSALINRRARASAPRALLASAVRGGTLLSWKPVPSAVRYEVLAARELTATLYLTPPPTLPNGFQLEGALPKVSEPGAPGSVPVTLSMPGGFEPVAETESPYVVRPPGNYVYQVVGVNSAGMRSAPSNVQVVPEPEPAATFGSLEQAAAPSGGGSARTAGRSPLARQLQAADAAYERGDRRGALALLRRLRSSGPGKGEEWAMLAERLERVIEYSSVEAAR